MKTYAFVLNAQLADFSDPHFASVIYGGSETYLGKEEFTGTWPEAQKRLEAFAAKQTRPCYASIRLANRNDRAPAGFKNFRGVMHNVPAVTPTHAQHAAAAKVSTPCTAASVTFGGRCLNCGYDPRPGGYDRSSETPQS